MSHLRIKNDVLEQLISVIGVANLGYTIGIANENGDFDPNQYEIWVQPYYIPTTSESLGKGYRSLDDERGFYQVSIYVKQDNLTMYNKQLELIDVIRGSMWNGSVYGCTQIAESTLNNGRPSDGWFVRDLTLNLISYIARG